MPAAYSFEFRARAVAEVHRGEKSVVEIAKNLQISESCLRRWIDIDDTDNGSRPGITTAEKKELTELRKRLRVLEVEHEILKRAAAFFARENVLPK